MERPWTADAFVAEYRHSFGDAWRYEQVDGQVLALEAPEPEHGAILAGLVGAVGNRLTGKPNGFRPESGGVAIPKSPDRKRRDMQAVEGVKELVELSQEDFAAHIHRLTPDEWVFEGLSGPEAVLRLTSVDLKISLSEIYRFADVADASPDQ